ncbi:hypothetical protein EJ110_NYTH25949 [Nymphaea thermarum]|nr:hypothetical protein EJ110_NYTH25949 [Nymphaea thermarum]
MAACEFSRSGMAGKLLSFESQLDKPDTTIYNLAHEFSQACSHGRNEAQADDLWMKMKEEAKKDVEQEPLLGSYYVSAILAHDTLESALATHLGYRLGTPSLPGPNLAQVFLAVFSEDCAIGAEVREDLKAIKERDPACVSYVQIMLNFKGFLAIQAHRVAHWLWLMSRGVRGLCCGHTPRCPGREGGAAGPCYGTVIGETAIIGDNVSILHNVTLGGTGEVVGDRHPKIGDGVLVGAGTHVLGNVRVGAGAKIGAGSVVLKEVPESTTAVGNPARLLGGRENPVKLTKVPSFTMDQTYEWSDYVI